MKRKILVIVLVQTLLLAGMIAMKQYTLRTGTVVLLETEPFDPRSLFRGDYVVLRYAINTLDLAALDGDDAFERHDTVHVTLAPDGDYWKPVAVHRDAPDTVAGTVTVKGTVRYAMHAGSGDGEPRELSVRYGIENYFVPEGEGRELELRPSADHRVDIRVAVDRFGKAGIKAVLVNGETRYEERLF